MSISNFMLLYFSSPTKLEKQILGISYLNQNADKHYSTLGQHVLTYYEVQLVKTREGHKKFVRPIISKHTS